MTARQKRLHKLANVLRAIRGGEFSPPQTDKKTLERYEKRLALCKAKGDL